MPNPLLRRTKIKDICSYTIMVFLFSLPLSTTISNILAILIVLLWFADRNFKEKLAEIRQNKVVLAVLAYILLHIIGLLWTSDMAEGFMLLKKQWKLLLLPVIMNMADTKHTRHYIFSFFIAMTVSMSLSYLVWFEFIKIKPATPHNPTPFISHIVYGPFLALAIYIGVHEILFTRSEKLKRIILFSIACAMTINLALTLGRTGHVVFFLLTGLLIFQYFKKNYLKATFVSFLCLTILLLAGYTLSSTFKARVNRSYQEFHTTIFLGSKTKLAKGNNPNQRLIYWWNTMKIIQKNPFIGIGTGDFSDEYSKRIKTYNYDNTINKFYSSRTDNPHNQYLRVTCQFGIIGLLMLLSIFYQQFKSVNLAKNEFNHLRLAFPFFYLIIFIGDSYLQASATTLLFSTFSGFLYKKGGIVIKDNTTLK